MNLFHNPSLSDLRKLLKDADPKPLIHNLVVDSDGEVILDPELKQPDIDINRYPFRFRLRTPQDYFEQGSNWVKNVYNYLMMEWENKMQKTLVQ